MTVNSEFIKRTILVTSTPAAASVYACLVILAHNIPGLARGNANAWHVAWGKSGGKTMVNPVNGLDEILEEHHMINGWTGQSLNCKGSP